MVASSVDEVVNLCVRRGFITPSCEAYGVFAGFFDYGPLGVELKRNVENAWWNRFVRSRDDVVGMDGALVNPPAVWKASGHVESFNDPLVECVKCKARHRADHLVQEELKLEVDGLTREKLASLIKERGLKCLKCGGALSEAKAFNLMFKTFVGPVADEANAAFLRPETAQLIFVNFKTVQAASRKKLPFGIAQSGKAFRNEISPRNFVFRAREFSQLEIEYFTHPNEGKCQLLAKALLEPQCLALTAVQQGGKKSHSKTTVGALLKQGSLKSEWVAYWLAEFLQWLQQLGLEEDRLRLRQHVPEELSHYSRETWDVEFDYPEWGWKELMGVADRGDFDLSQHEKHSGKDFHLFDEKLGKKILPRVVEPSLGLDRLAFALLANAFTKAKDAKGGERVVLALSSEIAPVKASVFPLVNKDGLREKAREVFESLLQAVPCCEFDDSGSIGRRYARADEAGTPFCITVDYQTMEDGTVTVRERDSGKQERVQASELSAVLARSENAS